jgi:type I restriction enzyme S subunit
MAGEWAATTLEKAPLEIIDGDRGENYPNQAEFASAGYCLFLNAGNVTASGFNFSDCAFITKEKDTSLRKGKLLRHDVVLTTRGTVGNAAYFDDSVPFSHIRINSGMVILRARPAGLEPRYLYLFVRSALFHTQVSALRTGSAQPQLPIRDINRIEIPIPPLPEQRAIAHILGMLDDKIELNRRMNETLEAMARALFKSWFVDFDPVRAKAKGRDPGLPKPLADLFPDRFEDSVLGEIPAGWQVKVLDDLAGVVLGGDWGGDEPMPEKTMAARCIRGADIPDLQAGGMGKMPIRYLKPSSLEKRRLTDGDLVVEISGGSPTQSTGRPVLVSDRLLRRLDAPLVCSNFCRLLKPRKPTYSKFVYLWLRALYTNDEFLQFENGTTGIKNLAFTLFSSSYRLGMPPEAVLTQFEAQVVPLFARQQAGAAETDSLAALRDTLLPKLISGELRVKDAERFIGRVTP